MRAGALATLLIAFAAPALAAPCDIWAYVTDPDPNGLNIRGGPGTNHRIVGVIKKDSHESIVHITEMKNGWARLDRAEGHESGNVFNTKGWVSMKLVAISTRGYDGKGVPARKVPGRTNKISGKFPSEDEVQLLDCRGDWARIRDRKGTEGWLDPNDSCATALTYCN